MEHSPTILWLRRDLRSVDHPALNKAIELDPDFTAVWFSFSASNPRQKALALKLMSEQDKEGSPLHNRVTVVHADHARSPKRQAQIVLDYFTTKKTTPEKPLSTVIVQGDWTPDGIARDRIVASTLAHKYGVTMRSVGSAFAVDPGHILTCSGTPYKVFTPFYNAWRDCGHDEPVGGMPTPGSSTAWDEFVDFVDTRLDGYSTNRDFPALFGTSRMSAYLALGAIHPRSMLEYLTHAEPAKDRDAYARELAFREFYADFLFHRPETALTDVNDKFAHFRWNSSGKEFLEWAAGRTGFPIIDAGMRQLHETGWMHNRVRMLVASFLTKDLHLHWTVGADYFRDNLIDFDVANNQHSWQWSAGTGTDASPYFRVFNPMTQGKKFDPDALYIKKWVPELQDCSPADIHAIRNLPASYPRPLVDHAEERKDALARYEEIR